jgi:hypothetical protein
VLRPELEQRGALSRSTGGVGTSVGSRRIAMASLLDAGPLEGNVKHGIEWDALHANVGVGEVDSVSVVATDWSDLRPPASASDPAPRPN